MSVQAQHRATAIEPGAAEKRARVRDGDRKSGLRLEPHCCRSCFGRIASFPAAEGGDNRIYQCTNCGLEASGHKPGVVCACGIKLRKRKGDGRSAETLVDAGIRCHENRRVSPDFPSLFTASFGGAQAET